MNEELPYRKLTEVAQLLLRQAREYAGGRNRVPTGGGWNAQLAGASEWLPREVEAVCSSALFTTFGAVVDQLDLEEIEDLRSLAEDAREGR